MNTLDNIEKAAKSIIDICNEKKLTKLDKDKLIKYQTEILALIDNLVECDNCDTISDFIATITLNGVTANLCQDCGVRALKAGKIEKRVQQTEKKENVEDNNPQSSSQVLKSELSQIPHLSDAVIENLARAFNNLQDIANATVKELQSVEGVGQKRALTIKNELAKRLQQSTDSKSQKSDNSNTSEDNKEPEIDWDALYTEIQSRTSLKRGEIRHIHKLINEIAVPMKMDNTIAYITAEIDMSKLKLDRSDLEKTVTMLMEKVKRKT